MSNEQTVGQVANCVALALTLLVAYTIYDAVTPPKNERLSAYATERYAQTLATNGLRGATYSDSIGITVEDASGSHELCDIGCPRGAGRTFELSVTQDGRVEVRAKVDMAKVGFESAKGELDEAVAIVLKEYASYQQRAASWQVPTGATATQTTSLQ